MRQRDEMVGRIAHRREDGHDLATFALHRHQPLRDVAHVIDLGQRRPAELAHHERVVAPAIEFDHAAGLRGRRSHHFSRRNSRTA
jgi:hypothetical protein